MTVKPITVAKDLTFEVCPVRILEVSKRNRTLKFVNFFGSNKLAIT
jgi:hypothetical protein